MARKLALKPQVLPANGEFPYGRIKDDTGSNDGTPVDEEVYGDFHQFFARIMALANVNYPSFDYNNEPENFYDGFQFVEALQKLFAPLITGVSQISGMPFSSINSSLATVPAGAPGQLYYRDGAGRIWFSGRPLKATTNMNVGDVLFVVSGSYLPANSPSLTRGDVYFAVPVSNLGAPYNPSQTRTCRLDVSTGQMFAEDFIFTNDILDFRALSYLGA